MPKCYRRIAILKEWKRSNQSEIFPAYDLINGQVLDSRAVVNGRLAEVTQGAVAARQAFDPKDSATADGIR
jgi:hypothetical protein